MFNDSLLLDVAKPAGARPRFRLRLFAGLSRRRPAVPRQRAHGAASPRWFGLADARAGRAASFVTVAVWWLLFTIPLMRGVQRAAARSAPAASATADCASDSANSATPSRTCASTAPCVMFLLAYWFYIDGVNTIIKMAVNYGTVAGARHRQPAARRCWSRSSWDFRRRCCSAGSAIASARSAASSSGSWCTRASPCTRTSSIPRREFFALAVAVGLVQGGVQSLSRSLFGRLVPEGKNAEFFGFYNMMGKFATVLGPLLIAIVAGAHAQRARLDRLAGVVVRDRRRAAVARAASHRELPDFAFEAPRCPGRLAFAPETQPA